MKYSFVDTPGLNEIGREADLKHMMAVIRMIRAQLRFVHSLVLVYRFKSRMDAATKPSLCYYRDLFAPLFRAGNVILVLTHVSSEDYEIGLENNTFDNEVAEHLTTINEILELNTPAWNCPIVMYYFLNSKWSTSRIQEFLKLINSKKEPSTNDLLWRSYLMREKILDYIAKAPAVVFYTHLISLPPMLEIERKNALAVINGRIKELLETVRIENNTRANQLREQEDLRTQIALENNKITQCDHEINELSATQKTPSKYVAGDDWIRLVNAGTYTLDTPCGEKDPCGGCQCKYRFEAHNATQSPETPKPVGGTWKITVNPNWINITRRENRYWFYRFWLEYEGTRHYAKKIQTQTGLLLTMQNTANALQGKLDASTKELATHEQQLTKHNENLKKLNDDKDILLQTKFHIDDIQEILDSIETHLHMQK